MKDETILVTAGRHPEQNHGVVNPPVYHASTILYPTLDAWEAARAARERGERGVYYGRAGTPTAFSLQDVVCALEGGHRAELYPSGLAAIATALMAYVKSGDHVLVADTVYGPCRRFCNQVYKQIGVETTFFDPCIDAAELAGLVRPNTRLLYLESPGSLTFEVQDVPRLAAVGQRHGLTVLADNTWASPLYFKPLAHGVDVAIHAATKYIVGHSDAMLGVVVANERAWPELERATHNFGQTAGPDDIYLGQRGIRTLAVRLERHWRSGVRLAEWLAARPEVASVMHPALPDDPGHALWKRDYSGASGLFGVVLARPYPKQAVAALVEGLELFGIGASWGGYESLIITAHPETCRNATTWRAPGPCLRIHAGLEDADDLIADLEAGFARLKQAAGG